MIKILIFINLLLVLGQFFLSTERAADGNRLSRIQSELQSIQLANSDLNLKIYSQSSISRIMELAKARDFVEAKLSAWTPPPVALKVAP